MRPPWGCLVGIVVAAVVVFGLVVLFEYVVGAKTLV